MNTYTNVLCEEMEMYLALMKKAKKYTAHVQSLFKELEGFIPENSDKDNALSSKVILNWNTHLNCSPATRKKKLSALCGFIKFLLSAGISCELPEIPRGRQSQYLPYIFDETEWKRIINTADNLYTVLKRTGSDMPIAFPMIIRILYSCGLRLSEALFLKIGDFDFKTGTLIIRNAKRNKQRFVPMKQSTTNLLMKYCLRRGLLQNPESYIFIGEDGKPHSQSWVERWFSITLELSGIKQNRNKPGERGICLHCLRHSFVFHSFQSSESLFEEMVPFLSTYLGHENIMETDRYLKFSYELYYDAQKKISDYTSDLFPKVKP